MPRLTILTPVYNDEAHLPEYLESLISQQNLDYEALIINDGSTDGTKALLDDYQQRYPDKLRVFHQNNQGQQEAILSVLPYIQGRYVLLAHSDDAFCGKDVLSRNLEKLSHSKVDGLFCDFITMDGNGHNTGNLNYSEAISRESLQGLMVHSGTNRVPDHFFCRYDAFVNNIIPIYLRWNMPYWISVPEIAPESKLLQLEKSPDVWYRYRVYNQNYHLSESGQFVMSNGCIRTVLYLSRQYRTWPGILRKWVPGCRNSLLNYPSSRKTQYKYIHRTLSMYYRDKRPSDLYFRAFETFWQDKSRTGRVLIAPEELTKNEVYFGKDALKFFKALRGEQLPSFYQWLLEETAQGTFTDIKVKHPQQAEYLQQVLFFLNMPANIHVVEG
jgi:glycosyltransferase involved in cell wall biosynthesis